MCLGLCTVAVAVFLISSTPAASQQSPKRQKWEYKIGGPMAEYVLTQHGDDGWELVAVASDVNGGPQLIFKRPK